jgi:methylenetetrahydrofolate dehydrogenase (NADP+)/methenyltetrahydrofolate cyclohydrolase
MAAELIDGAMVAARVRSEVRDAVATMPVKPGLATILVGEDPASAVYVASKRRTCVELGIRDLHQHLSADVTQEAPTPR